MALENDLVLWELSHHLSYSDLKSLRQVCQKWNSNMQCAFFRCAIVTVSTIDQMKAYTQEEVMPHINFSLWIPVSQTVQIVPSNFSSFFSKYSGQIRSLKFLMILNAHSLRNQGWLNLLLQLNNVIELDIKIEFYELISIYYRLPLSLIPVLSSLKTFKISISCHIENLSDLGLRRILRFGSRLNRIIVRMTPNVKTLVVKPFYFPLWSTCCLQLGENLLKEQPHPFSRLQDLQIMITAAGSPKWMRTLPMSLKRATLLWTTRTPHKVWAVLTDFLEKQAETLEELKIGLSPSQDPTDDDVGHIGLTFPKRMPRLKTLQICFSIRGNWTNFKNTVKFPLQSVDYAETFPLLETLTIQTHFGINAIRNVMLSPNISCQSVKRISIMFPHMFWWNIYEIRKGLMRSFPQAVIAYSSGDSLDFWYKNFE